MDEDDIGCFSTRRGAKEDRLDLEGHSICTTSMDIAELAFLFSPMLSIFYLLIHYLSDLLLSLQAAFYGMWRTKKTIRPVGWEDIKREDIQCPEPIRPWHNWEAITMAAGQHGVPELNYTSNNSTAHRLSLFDVDKRDMRMAIYVDNILRGLTSDFDLDLEEDCGLNVYLCARKNFSGGLLVVPAGKHEVSIQWNGKGTIQHGEVLCMRD